MSFTDKDNVFSNRQTLVRTTVARFISASEWSANTGVYSTTLTLGYRVLRSVERNGLVLTKAEGTLDTNDTYNYDETTGDLNVKLASAPTDTNNILVVKTYKFFTDGVTTAFAQTPTTPVSNANPIRAWVPCALSTIKSIQSIRNNIFGVVDYQATNLPLDYNASDLRRAIEDKKYSLVGQDVEVYFKINGDVVQQPTLLVFNTGPRVTGIQLDLPLASAISKLSEKAVGKHSKTQYWDIGNVPPSALGKHIPLIFGPYTSFVTKPMPYIGWDGSDADRVFDLDKMQKAVCVPYSATLNTTNNTVWVLGRTPDTITGPTVGAYESVTVTTAVGTLSLTDDMVQTAGFQDDSWYYPGHGLKQNDRVYFTGSVPSGIFTNRWYYAERLDSNYFAVRVNVDTSSARVALGVAGDHTIHKGAYRGPDTPSGSYETDVKEKYSRYHHVTIDYEDGTDYATHGLRYGDAVNIEGTSFALVSYEINGMVVSLDPVNYKVHLICQDLGLLFIPGAYDADDIDINVSAASISLVLRDLNSGEMHEFLPQEVVGDGSSSIITDTENGETLYKIDLDAQSTLWDAPEKFNTTFPDPENHEIGFFFRTDADTAKHASVVQYLAEASGLSVNANSITAANTELTTNVVMSIPSRDDGDLLPYKVYIERILRSTGGYVYINNSGELVYRLFEAPTSGTIIGNQDILPKSWTVTYDYSELATRLRASNREITDQAIIDATPSPETTVNNQPVNRATNIEQVSTLEHVLESFDDTETRLKAIRTQRVVRYSFSSPSTKLIEAEIGDDLTLNNSYTDNNSINVKIVHLEKSIRGVTVEALALEDL